MYRLKFPDLVRSTWVLAILLVGGAALLAVGVNAERGNGDQHVEASTPVATSHSEQSESGTGTEGQVGEVLNSPSENSEKMFGINLESNLLVTIGVLASIALAGLMLWRASRLVFLLVVAYAAVFTLLDAAEFIHQIDQSHAGVAVIAGVVALMHALVAVLSAQRIIRPTPATKVI